MTDPTRASALTPGEAARLFPRGVGDPFCPDGGRIETPTDHRLLWHLENLLAVDAPTGSRLDEVRRDLRRYLNVRCDHHWHHYYADGDIGAHWQCLWCNDVLWLPDMPMASWQVCNPNESIEDWPVASREQSTSGDSAGTLGSGR